jgi:hypothetical protein
MATGAFVPVAFDDGAEGVKWMPMSKAVDMARASTEAEAATAERRALLAAAAAMNRGRSASGMPKAHKARGGGVGKGKGEDGTGSDGDGDNGGGGGDGGGGGGGVVSPGREAGDGPAGSRVGDQTLQVRRVGDGHYCKQHAAVRGGWWVWGPLPMRSQPT